MISPRFSCAAIIVAGGQSSRMGTDKAQLVWRGETLLERAARCCREARLSPVVIAGRSRPPQWHGDELFVPDEEPQAGPLAGLSSGLLHIAPREKSAQIANSYAVALPCDMPLLTPSGVRWLAYLAKQCADLECLGAAAVTTNGQLQPLFAVYSAALLPAIHARLASGRRSLVGLIESEALLRVPLPAEIAEKIASVNTPDELARLWIDNAV